MSFRRTVQRNKKQRIDKLIKRYKFWKRRERIIKLDRFKREFDEFLDNLVLTLLAVLALASIGVPFFIIIKNVLHAIGKL